MANSIPLSLTGGRYGEDVRRAIEVLADKKDGQAEVAARLLDLLVATTSEHTLSLAIRSLRQRPMPSPHDVRPCEDAVRAAAAKLATRDDAQDDCASRILLLIADLVSEADLDRVLALLEPNATRRKAA